jgi:hypothetical protein
MTPNNSVTAWGDSSYGGSGSPIDSGYTEPLLVGDPEPPSLELPQAVIEPSHIRAAKAELVEYILV